MPLSVSLSDIAKDLAEELYGVTDTEHTERANRAIALALQEVAASTKLISQQKEGTLSLTGANTYALTDIHPSVLTVVKSWTSWGPVNVIRKAEFVTRFPDFAAYSEGIPRYAVLWGDDSLYIWPDQSNTTLNVMYYRIAEEADAGQVSWALMKIAREYGQKDPKLRILEHSVSKDALKNLNKSQTRSVDNPLHFLVEPRVNTINHFKRTRR